MKWMNTELTKKESDLFKGFLKDNNIQYEASECGDFIHFEVLCDSIIASKCNDFIDEITFGFATNL